MFKWDTKLGACRYKEPIKDTLMRTRTEITQMHYHTQTRRHTHTMLLRHLTSVLHVKVIQIQTSAGTQRE